MSIKRLIPVMLMLIIGCQHVSAERAEAGQAGVDQEIPILPASMIETTTETVPNEQLDINKNALLKDPNELIRIKAANVLLFSDNPQARDFLINDVLNQANNSAARIAVCKALIQIKSSQESIINKEDFIQPLLGVFNTENDIEAQLAADAILIFEYEKIEKSLENIVMDATQPARTRINAIGALKKLPKMNAIIRLIRLVDDPEKQIAAEAEKALRSLSMPVGANRSERDIIIADLVGKGIDAFLLKRLKNQETLMQQIQVELESWQNIHLELLNKTYRSYSDDTAKGKFLVEHLVSPKAAVKLWALEQVSQRIQSTNPVLPNELNPILIGLISDQNRDVRLKTADLLALMRTLNSASPLLAQLKVETDEQVRGQLLDALGWVCFYALSPSSLFKISPEIRQQALNLAGTFLSDKDTNKAQIGARVMKKLLERNGLTPDEVSNRLNLFVGTYNEQEDEPNEPLRGALLNAMAGLVAEGSACKAQTGKLFEPFFRDALDSKTDFVREAAVDGLANIDETKALIILRKKGFANDLSSNVRSKMTELAKNVGGSEDLYWLADKIGSNGESQLAWQAMFTIFGRSDADVLKKWTDQFTGDQSKFSVNQKIDFLNIVEQKAVDDDKREAQKKLAGIYYETGQFDQAAEYFGMLQITTQNPNEQRLFLSKQLDAYLRWPNLQLTAELIQNCLNQGDLELNGVIIQSIDNYLSNQPEGTDLNAVLKVLTDMDNSSSGPKWREQIKDWANRFMITSEPNEPGTIVNE